MTTATGSQKELRRINRNRVFRTLCFANHAITRQEICETTGLNLPLVSRVTTEMLEAGLLEEVFPAGSEGRRGRRCTALQCRSDGAYVIAVAITAYSQKILVGNLKGHIVYTKAISGVLSLSPEELIPFLVDAIQKALHTSDIPPSRLLGASMAIPRQMLMRGNAWSNTPSFESYLLEHLQARFSIPFVAMRLAEMFNLAEVTWGASRGFKNVLCLHLAHFVGASLLHEDVLLSLPDRIGNISQMPIARMGATTSELPRIVNTASGMSILHRLGFMPTEAQQLKYTMEDTINLALVNAQSLAGDSTAQAAFADAGTWMGYALEILYHVYHPYLIVFVGSLTENTYYMEALQTTWQSLHLHGTPVEMRLGTLSVGSAAALTAIQYHVTSPDLDLDTMVGKHG